MNIWVLDSESGITLLYKAYMDLPIDEDLISGLLAALNQFTTYELKEGIESIEMGGLRWSYLEEKDANLLFVATSEKNISSNMLKARLNIIKHSFIEQFVSDNRDEWKSLWKGNTEHFSPFKDTIDEYYSQNNPELSKISFSRVSGINIININPANCDMIVVEKQVINLITRLVNKIKQEEGYFVTLHYFIEENVFEYLISNLTLLSELNLFKFLLQLFLFK